MAPPRKKQKTKGKQVFDKERRESFVEVEELDPNRKPRTSCREITRRNNKKKKTPMVFDENGVAVSKERAKWSSWVGKTARTRLDIAFNDWRKVPWSEKMRLWDECRVNFIIFNFILQHILACDFRPDVRLTVMALPTHQLVKFIKQLSPE